MPIPLTQPGERDAAGDGRRRRRARSTAARKSPAGSTVAAATRLRGETESERVAGIAPDSAQRVLDVGREGRRTGAGQRGGPDAPPSVAPLIVPPNPFAHTPWTASSLSSRDRDATRGRGGWRVDPADCFRFPVCPVRSL